MTSLICKTLISRLTTLRLQSNHLFCSSLINCSNFRIIRSMSSQRIFQLKVDPLTGNSEWVLIEEDDDTSSKSPEALLSSTSYLDMLNDTRRNRAYREAIEKTVTKPCHVLDIGAGTGFLSMMAARAMDSSGATECSDAEGIVSACESYLPMIKLMRKVLHINGMDKKINILPKRSDEVEVGVDLASHANILVSEILDSELLGEGLIPTLQHAHDRLLVKNPQTVPYRATTYGQLVESKFLWKLHDLYSHEAEAMDSIHLVPAGLEKSIRVKPHQYPMQCNAISEEIRLLSEPFKIFEFDFWKRPDSHGKTEIHINATSDGRVHAVVSWWVLQLDYEGTIFYSTAPQWISSPSNTEELKTQYPSTADWCEHWKQCVWFIPGIGVPVLKGEQVAIQAAHDDISVSYNLKHEKLITDPCHYDVTRDCELILSPERIATYGDKDWRFAIITALKNAKKVCSLCVVADDSVLLTILIASLSSSHVIAMFPGIQDKGAQYLQCVADANNFSMNRVEVVGKKKCLTMDDTNHKQVDLLIGEPFYYANEGMLPWRNLRFWKERTMLDPVLSKDSLILPCKGILKACAMSIPDLWRSRCGLKTIEGFQHSVVNATLGACGDMPVSQEGPCLPYFVWQCGDVKELSEMFTIMEFDFSKPISACSGKTKVEFVKAGICHGFALWIDWVMDEKNSIVVSTGPDHRYWKQGVKLLSTPVAVGIPGSCDKNESASTEIEAFFDPSNGDLTVKHSFL